jgi:hypothetical protein
VERDFEWDLEDLLRDLAGLAPLEVDPPGDLRSRVRRARTHGRRLAIGVIAGASALLITLHGRG